MQMSKALYFMKSLNNKNENQYFYQTRQTRNLNINQLVTRG